MTSSILLALGGGALVGAAAALLLLSHGRVAGVSGIAGGLLERRTRDRAWRGWFLAGLLFAGGLGSFVAPDAIGASVRSLPAIAIAGVLVGFGTRLGNGCTSGHGVCGLSRLSVRSAVAVATFMIAGAITATVAGAVS
jgi:uncharacterized membrane protein YedE/YeeE